MSETPSATPPNHPERKRSSPPRSIARASTHAGTRSTSAKKSLRGPGAFFTASMPSATARSTIRMPLPGTVCAGAPSGPVGDPELVEHVDARVEKALADLHGPGIVVEVQRGDRAVVEKGYGVSDVDTAAPMDPSTKLAIASVTKMFTTVAVLEL